MKVLIDLIENLREAISKEQEPFTLAVMGLKEDESSNLIPKWKSSVGAYKIDKKAKTLFLFLSKDKGLETTSFFNEINALANEEMMYEVKVSYAKDSKRIDQELIGFGESLEDKEYLCFLAE